MILLLPGISATGLDVSFVWDNFKMDLSSLCSSDKFEFWSLLRKCVEELHPNRSYNETVNLLRNGCSRSWDTKWTD